MKKTKKDETCCVMSKVGLPIKLSNRLRALLFGDVKKKKIYIYIYITSSNITLSILSFHFTTHLILYNSIK